MNTPITQQGSPSTSNNIITPTIGIQTTAGMSVTVEDAEVTISEEIKDFEKTVTETMLATNKSTDKGLMTNEVHSPKIFNSPEKEEFGVLDDKEEEEEAINSDKEEMFDSDEDYDEDDDDDKKKKQNYTSHQHTLPSSTLLHGFISNPGYPSYYIGNDKDKECKWKLRMSKGQKMSLTILDLHLRSE